MKHNPIFYLIDFPLACCYKIGFSRNLSKRLYTINRYSPIKIQPIYAHPKGTEMERFFKMKFKKFRLEGKEFFLLNNIDQIANDLNLVSVLQEDIVPGMHREFPVIYEEMEIYYSHPRH
jgi:hypothetical protein